MRAIEDKDKAVKESFLLWWQPFFCFGYITAKILLRLKIMSAKYDTKEYYQRLKNPKC